MFGYRLRVSRPRDFNRGRALPGESKGSWGTMVPSADTTVEIMDSKLGKEGTEGVREVTGREKALWSPN